MRDEWLTHMTAQGQICPVLWAVKKKAVRLTVNRELAERSHGQVTLAECHHMRGRIGRLLCDTRFWLAVSSEGHKWIHNNIEKARALGFVCPVGEWNTVPANVRTGIGTLTVTTKDGQQFKYKNAAIVRW